MGAPAKIKDLVERFPEQKHDLNEAQVRQTFIDPLFGALGWDVSSKKQRGQVHREVVLEDSLRVEGAMKAPDYGFYLGPSRKFFVEAKAPTVNIDTRVESALQLRRYGWSAGLPLSILTDFEEFAVYDCQIRPEEEDTARTARTTYLTFDKYEEKWDDIVDLFSKEAVRSGSLDALMVPSKKKGSLPVDKAFLSQIEGWREALAKNIHQLNPSLNRWDLNYAVQATIDRIVFLRVCEDRGVEEYGKLERLLEGSGVYDRLCNLFRDADSRYNSGLFHFSQDEERGFPDDLTPELGIEDEVLKDMIQDLYYPKSPYQFSVMPVEILGQTYEQFLGKVIRIEDSGEVSVEEKPEVRKAGGVYYTPTYIVDYIVENTVGKLVEGKTPKQASSLKIVDPACGSGSFLIAAYEYLLDWHLRWYVDNDPEKHPKAVFEYEYPTEEDTATEWRLRIGEKKRILTNNIYGVDIDDQAVEVTKLSLLLKVLEGETSDSMESQLSLFDERVLPYLGKNIQSGNSLIGHDFYENEQLGLLDEEEERRINTFDWESAFPEIFSHKNPGFDAVIGNPPYIDSEWMSAHHPLERSYCTSHYEAASGNWDIFCVFIEKALALCRLSGLTGFIVPNKLGSAGYATGARRVLTSENRLRCIRDYSSVPVFPVAVYPIVYVAESSERKSRDTVRYERMELTNDSLAVTSEVYDLGYDRYFGQPSLTWPIFSKINKVDPTAKMRSRYPFLEDVAEITGAATVAEAYKIQPVIEEGSEEDADALKVVNSGTIDRYSTLWGRKNFRYLGDSYVRPMITTEKKNELPDRRRQQAEHPKIIVAGMTKMLECIVDLKGSVLAGKSTSVIFSEIDLRYLVALLNSSLVNFYYVDVFGGNRLQGGYLRIGPPQLRSIPICTIDFSDPEDTARHDRMVTLVEQMMELHEQLAEAKTPHSDLRK